MVAIYPVLHGVVLKVVAVTKWQDDFPESLQVVWLGLALQIAVSIVVVACTTKLHGVLYTNNAEKAFLGVRTEIEMLPVEICPCGIRTIGEGVRLSVIAVHEFTESEVEIQLQPTLGIRHCNESVSAKAHLWNGFGIGAVSKEAYRQRGITNGRVYLTAACLDEEFLVLQVHVCLLEIHFVVGMHGGYHIDGARETEVVGEGMLCIDGTPEVRRIGTVAQHVVAVGHQLVGGIVARTDSSLGREVVGNLRAERVLGKYC